MPLQYTEHELWELANLDPMIPVMIKFFNKLDMFPKREDIQAQGNLLIVRYIDVMIANRQLRAELAERSKNERG